MGINNKSLCFLFSILLFSGLCQGKDKTVLEVVGYADFAESNIKPSQAFSGLRVTIDCKAENGELETRGEGKLDNEGKFIISLPGEILENGKLKQVCFSQLHSASNTPCPSLNGLESSKLVFENKLDQKHIFTTARKLKFSPSTCTSASWWPHFKHKPLPKFSLPPPIPFYKKPCPPLAPFFKKPLPPPVPIYKPKPTPPVYTPKPTPPVYKPPPYVKPLPPPVPVYKPKPKPKPPVYKPKPKPPVYKPKPKPPVYKKQPCPPIYKKPLPPVPIYKPLPPIPTIPKKAPCPPLHKLHPYPKIPPKYFHHPIFAPWPPHSP